MNDGSAATPLQTRPEETFEQAKARRESALANLAELERGLI